MLTMKSFWIFRVTQTTVAIEEMVVEWDMMQNGDINNHGYFGVSENG